jgi:membrane-bound metal-dependent hydrolase YbcI (DUF457 family)
MTGAGHLSSALLIKSRFKTVPFWSLLLASEAIELTWVFLNLNLIGLVPPLEITNINLPFLYIGDMKLIQQFVSHSLMGALLTGVLLAFFFKLWKKIDGIFIAIFLGVMSHWILDFIAHDKDLPIFISEASTKVGALLNFDASNPDLGFFTTAPILGFLFQSLYSFFCAFLFYKNFPSDDLKKKKKFWIFVIIINLTTLRTFIKGGMTWLMKSSTIFIVMVLVDIIINAILFYFAAKTLESEN